jgi:DNA processing protein
MSVSATAPRRAPTDDRSEDLSRGERLARLRLARSRNVGPRTFLHLLRRFGSAEAAIESLPELAARGGSPDYSPCPADLAEEECAAGEAFGARLVALGDDGYPANLARIDTPPPVLWIRGRSELFARPAVAIVGARNASALGLRTARRLARDLGAAGQVVVSGLARGIDAAAHEAALDTGTLAVMAGGIDQIYPLENADLTERIAEEGALVSEAPVGTVPTGRHFPKRNRLVAGLAQGVLLIEAASRSGSLITARYALDQGREVMAVPGTPEDPRATGCNALIRDGAALIREADDVLDALAAPAAQGLAEEGGEFSLDGAPFIDEEEDESLDPLWDFDPEGDDDGGALAEQVMRLLGPVAVDIDELARATGSAPAQLSLAILELELAGRVETLPGQRVALADPES